MKKSDQQLLKERLTDLRDMHKREHDFIQRLRQKSTANQEAIFLIIEKNGNISSDSLRQFLIDDVKLHDMTNAFLSDIQSIVYTDSMFMDHLRKVE